MRSADEAANSKASTTLIALLFCGTCLAYLDRQVLSLLKPTLQSYFAWNDEQFAHMGAVFSLTTACVILFSGWAIDRLGVRRSYAWAMGAWSLVGIGHALATTVSQFVMARALLAIGESANGPAAVKATAQYLPVEKRSIALGWVTAATSIGAIAAPLIIPPIALALGWQAAFIVTGMLGFVWLSFWLVSTRNLRLSAQMITEAAQPVDFKSLLTDCYTIGIVGSRILADWVFWVILFWAPDIFSRVYHLNQAQLGGPVSLTYIMAATGALSAGFLFTAVLRTGWSINRARKSGLLLFAALALPVSLVMQVSNPWIGALLIGCAMFAHNGFSTNLFGLIADGVPLQRVGTVMALGSVASNISGSIMIEIAGWLLAHGYGYRPLLILGSVAYLAALLWLQVLLPTVIARQPRQ